MDHSLSHARIRPCELPSGAAREGCPPRLGRWLQRDPLGYVDGVNLYEHARSMLTFFVDPFGLAVSLDLDPDPGSQSDVGGGIGIGDDDDPGDDEGPFNGGYPAPKLPSPEEILKALFRSLLDSWLRQRGFDEETIEDIIDFFLKLFWRFFVENIESWKQSFDEWLAAWNANRANQDDDAAIGGKTPGRGHDRKSKPQKTKRFRNKAADKRKQKEEDDKKKWDDWNNLTDEQQKLLPFMHPNWDPDRGRHRVYSPPNVNESPWYDKALYAFWSSFFSDEFLRDMSTAEMVGFSAGASMVIVGTGGLAATAGAGAGAAAGTAAVTGARLVPVLAPSDRNIKDNFAPVNVREVLHRVPGLPISTWNY
jgi:hypothetical protein